MAEIKFFVDENIFNAVAEGLRTRGIDVLTTPEAGRQSLSDTDHLAFALLEQRVLVTQDEDFLIISSKSVEHAGIVYYKPQSRTIKQILAGLILIYDVLTAEEMVNHIEYI